ncbi:hypothetical protein [Anaerocaecibacter muris]|uniref:hypothetical protein n=1 Tax=Anaerocaecibacter muris TaxID=2941513 RepID=UPI003F68E050
MKDKQARALAIVALVFMGIFVVALIVTLVDHTLLNGAIGYVALCSGVFAIMIFIALKADGRGYSVTKMNNEIEMQKIEKALAEQAEREKAEQAEQNEQDDKAEDEPSENSTVTEQVECDGEGAKDESAEQAEREKA